MYVEDTLYNVFEGRTSFGGEHYNKFGIYHSWISRWNDKYMGEYPKQVIYYDNLFRTNNKEKLLKDMKHFSMEDIGGINFVSDIHSIKHENLRTRIYLT